jgi:3-hydroxyisobutyrate dehydrogenase
MQVNSGISSQGLKVSVVGTGRMGANIARRLKERGFQLVAFHDVNRRVAEELAVELGGEVPATLGGVSALADVVITVVTDDAAMMRIFAENGDSLLEGSEAWKGGRLFINCATVSPSVHVEVERRVEGVGGQSLESSMASSIPQAREGTLYLMCAGRPSAYERAFPVLEAMSSSIRYVGEAGTAGQIKALVNMVMNMNTAALAEGLGLAEALGLDLGLVREVFSQTGANSRVLQTDGEDMQQREHSCFFSASHAAKDSGIAVRMAEGVGLNLPLAKVTLAQFERLLSLGGGDLDKSAVAELTFKSRKAAD